MRLLQMKYWFAGLFLPVLLIASCSKDEKEDLILSPVLKLEQPDAAINDTDNDTLTIVWQDSNVPPDKYTGLYITASANISTQSKLKTLTISVQEESGQVQNYSFDINDKYYSRLHIFKPLGNKNRTFSVQVEDYAGEQSSINIHLVPAVI